MSMSIGEYCGSKLNIIKNTIKNANTSKLSENHKSVVSFMAVKSIVMGNNILSSRTEMYKNYPSDSDLIKKLTGFTADDFINGNATKEAKFLLDNERVQLLQLASLAKVDPSVFRKTVMEMNITGEKDVNDLVYDYAKDYWAGRFKGKVSSGIDRVFAMLASGTMLKKVQSATGNQNQFYDVHHDSAAIYNKSATIANMTERFHGEAARGMRYLTDMVKEFSIVTHDMISELHHYMGHDFVKDENKGPHESYEYSALRIELEKKLAEMKIDTSNIEVAMSEFVKFNDAFQKFNYGLTDNEKMFYDQNTDKVMIYKRSADRTTWSNDGVEYDPKNFKGSWLYKVQSLGEATIKALEGVDDKDLLPVERQIKENFSKESVNQFNIRLGYSPLFTKKNSSDGLLDIKAIADIPTLSFLKNRDEEMSGRSTKGNLFTDMNDELAITRLVYTQLADITLMRNTENMLKNSKYDNIITGRARKILWEKVETLQKHFNTKRPTGGLRAAIKLGSAFTTLYGSAILNKPSSAINNLVGGKIVARLNELSISGLTYGEVQNKWREKADGKEHIIKTYIDSYIDKIVQPFSRQEAAIATEESITDWEGKLTETVQYIADKTADASMMAVPAMMLEKFFGIDITNKGWIKNPVMSQRQSENTLRRDYYKGLALQMVSAKLDLEEYANIEKSNGLDAAIDKILADSADDIAWYERRLHGDFSRSAKSMKTMFAMSDADTFVKAALGMMVTFETMFKSPEIFAMASYIENLTSNAMALKETGAYAKAGRTLIASAGPALAFTLVDSGQWVGFNSWQPAATLNPAGSLMDVTELSFILTSTMLGNVGPEELAASCLQKLARIGGGVMMSGNLQQASFKMQQENMPMMEALVASFDLNPLNAWAGVKKKFGIEGKELIKEGENDLKNMAFYGTLLNRYTRRTAAVTGVVRDLFNGDLKRLPDKVVDLLIKDELGLKTWKPDALLYGSDKAIFQGNLINTNDAMSQDAYNAMRGIIGG